MFKNLFKNSPEMSELSFFDHIDKIRGIIIRIIILLLIGSIIYFINISFLYDRLIMAPVKHQFITYRAFCHLGHFLGLGNKLCMEDVKLLFQNKQLSGQFLQAMSSAFIMSVITCFPYILWAIWRYFKPTIPKEKIRQTKVILFFAMLLFFLGVAFGYFVIMPYTVNFFAAFSLSDTITNIITIKSYLSTLRQVVLGTALLFELPIIAYFLALTGLLSSDTLKNFRKQALVFILVIAAIITPPDVASQILVAIPLYMLYEISIIVIRRVEKKSV